MIKPIFRVLLSGLFLVILAGCGSSSTPEPTAEPTAIPTPEATLPPTSTPISAPVTRAEKPSQQAYIRLIQGSWDLPEVDIYVDGAIYGYNVRFGQVVEPQPLVSGTYTLRLIPSGLDINSHSQEVLFETEFTLPVGETLTFIMGGDVANLNIQVVSENIAPIDAGESRVSLIHALHQSGNLGVKVNDDVLIAPIEAYSLSHDAPIQDLNSRVYIVTPEGESIAEYGREFRSRTAVTLVIIGDASIPESVRLVNYTTRVYGDSSVYFVNSIGEQPSIDIYLDGTLTAGGVIYGQLHDQLILKPADYQLEILPSGATYQPSEVIYRAFINLYEDDTAIIALVHQNNRINHLVTLDVTSPTPPNQSRMWFVHAGDDSSVEMVVSNISNRLYGGDVTRERYIDAGSYDLNWINEDGASQSIPLTIEAGNNYIVVYVAPTVQPIIVNFAVGVEQAQVDDEQDPQSSSISSQTSIDGDIVSDGGALVYVLNLVNGENQIDLSIGENLIRGVPFGNLSAGDRIVGSNHEVRALVTGTDNIFSIAQYSFRDDYFYTIYVTGLNVASPRLYIFEHGLTRDLFDENQAIAQFSNLSLFGSDEFMLALSDTGVSLSPARTVIENPETDIETEGELLPNRYVVDGDYQVIHNYLQVGQITYPQYLTAGTYELILFDLATGYGITTLKDLNFQAGMRYDVIIQQDITTEEITFRVVNYPVPQETP
jgi:hypothetical protein